MPWGAMGAMLSRIALQSMNQTRSPRKHANRGRFTCFRGDLGSLEFLQRTRESMAPKSILNSATGFLLPSASGAVDVRARASGWHVLLPWTAAACDSMAGAA